MEKELEKILAKEVEKQSRHLIKRIFVDYLGLSQFFKVKMRKIFKKSSIRTYEMGGSGRNFLARGLTRLWEDMLGPYFSEGKKSRSLHEGVYVTLRNLTLSEWVPRSPGMIFARTSKPLIEEYDVVMGKIVCRLLDEDKFPLIEWPLNVPIQRQRRLMERFNPFANSQDVFIFGSGVVRLDQNENLKLMSASENDGFAEDGLPVILTTSAFDKVKKDVQRNGTVHIEEISGCLRRIPELSSATSYPSSIYSGMPRLALFVESRLNIKHVGQPDKINANVWTVLSNGAYLNEGFEMGYREYEQEILDAVDSIVDCKKEFFTDEHIIFDIDDIVPRFTEAKYNHQKLKKLFEK